MGMGIPGIGRQHIANKRKTPRGMRNKRKAKREVARRLEERKRMAEERAKRDGDQYGFDGYSNQY